MSQFEDQIYIDLGEVALSVLPEITVSYRTQGLTDQNWQNLVNEEALAVPFGIFALDSASDYADGPADKHAFQMSMTFYYICATADSGSVQSYGSDVRQYVFSRLVAFREALEEVGSVTPLSFILLPPWPTIDVARGSQVNRLIQSVGSKLFAGSLHAELVYWY